MFSKAWWESLWPRLDWKITTKPALRISVLQPKNKYLKALPCLTQRLSSVHYVEDLLNISIHIFLNIYSIHIFLTTHIPWNSFFISCQEPLNEPYSYSNLIDYIAKRSFQAEAWERGNVSGKKRRIQSKLSTTGKCTIKC